VNYSNQVLREQWCRLFWNQGKGGCSKVDECGSGRVCKEKKFGQLRCSSEIKVRLTAECVVLIEQLCIFVELFFEFSEQEFSLRRVETWQSSENKSVEEHSAG